MTQAGHPGRPERVLLFLCTGNYYRSRFGEELWNDREQREPTGWRAISRGISFANSAGNVGPISSFARRRLAVRQVTLVEPPRMPRLVEAADFEAAAHVVAMSRDEHRPMLIDRFPGWADRVEYWDVDDVALCAPEQALDRIEILVGRLRAHMAGGSQ